MLDMETQGEWNNGRSYWEVELGCAHGYTWSYILEEGEGEGEGSEDTKNQI